MLARLGEENVGYAVARVKASHSATWQRPPHIGELETLAVLPEHRSLGIGSLLIARVEQRFKGAGIEQLSLEALSSNEQAISFYLRQGYQKSFTHFVKALE